MLNLLCAPWALLGGRNFGELTGTHARPTPSSGLIGMAAALAVAVAVPGWLAWLQPTALAPWADAGALVLAGLGGLLFRQLGRGIEASASSAARRALGVLSLIALLPGAWVAATEVPQLLFAAQLAAHVEANEHAAEAAAKKTLKAQQQRQLLAMALAGREAEVDRLEQVALEWPPVLDAAAGRATRCERNLEGLRHRLADDATAAAAAASAAGLPGAGSHAAWSPDLEARETHCAEAQSRAAAVQARFESRVQRPLQNAASSLKAARAALTVSDTELARSIQATRSSRLECGALPACALHSAVADGQLSATAAWGSTLFLFALGLLPAALRSCLPPDSAARERRLDAAEEALLDGVLQRSHADLTKQSM